MPGKLLNSADRKRIADIHIKTIEYVTDRAGLVDIYRAARISLVAGENFNRVVNALANRAELLGISEKGVK